MGITGTLLAQFPTNSTSYSVSGSGSITEIASIVYGSRMYYAYDGGGTTGMFLQKGTVDGTLLTVNSFTDITLYDKPQFLANNSGLYLVSRVKLGSPNNGIVLMKVDTTLCSPAYTQTYTMVGLPNMTMNKCNFLNSGNIFIVGNASNFSNLNYGYVLCLNPTMVGAVAYSRTLSIGTSTMCSLNSFVEISNSSILLSGKNGVTPFISKGIKTVSTFSIASFSTYSTSIDISNMFNYGNPKKIMVYANSGTTSAVCKLDTNALNWGTEPASSRVGRVHAGTMPEKAEFYNGKLYVYNLSNYIEILDTSILAVTSKTYNVANGMLFRTITTNSTNLFITQTLASPFAMRFNTIKADLSANMSCMSLTVVPKNSYNAFTAADFATMGSPLVNSNTVITTAISGNETFTQTCINVGCIAPSAPANNTSSVNLTICSGNTTALTATSSGTVNWYTTPTGTIVVGTGSTLITPTLSAGTYTYYAEAVTCTNSINRTAIVVTVATCTGIDELDHLSTAKLYPNPNNGNFKIYLDEKVEIEVMDALGKIVYTEFLQEGESVIDIGNAQPGIYFVKMKLGSSAKVIKMIKQ